MSAFPQWIISEAYERQNRLCAWCGRYLPSVVWQAHHVNGDRNDHRVANCACVCVEPSGSCHLEVHHDDFGGDLVVPKSDYDYWNG